MIQNLPTHAGPVELDFSTSHRRPERPQNQNRLLLPVTPTMRFTPLKDGTQFVLEFDPSSRWAGRIFGGFDEAAFVTGLEEKPVAALHQGGEEAFFEALIPPAVRKLQEKFPGAPAIRQGDIWAVRIPLCWFDLGKSVYPDGTFAGLTRRKRNKKLAHMRKMKRTFDVTLQRGDRHVLRTNHSLKGHIAHRNHQVIEDLPVGTCAFATGILSAPDHADRDLTDGVHVLFRTAGLTSALVINGD